MGCAVLPAGVAGVGLHHFRVFVIDTGQHTATAGIIDRQMKGVRSCFGLVLRHTFLTELANGTLLCARLTATVGEYAFQYGGQSG